jgi:hypothetical protein
MDLFSLFILFIVIASTLQPRRPDRQVVAIESPPDEAQVRQASQGWRADDIPGREFSSSAAQATLAAGLRHRPDGGANDHFLRAAIHPRFTDSNWSAHVREADVRAPFGVFRGPVADAKMIPRIDHVWQGKSCAFIRPIHIAAATKYTYFCLVSAARAAANSFSFFESTFG